MNHLPSPDNNENHISSWLEQIQQTRVETPGYSNGNDKHRSQPWRPHNLHIPVGMDIPAPVRALNRLAYVKEDQSIRSLSPQSRINTRRGYLSARTAHENAALDDHNDSFTAIEPGSTSSDGSVYEKRARRKIRHDRYDTSNRPRKAPRTEKRKIKKTKESKNNRQKPESKLRSSMEVMDNFVSPSVLSSRVTMKPSLTAGLFGNGRASDRVHVTDLDFNDMTFVGKEDSTNERQRRQRIREKGNRRKSKALQEESELFEQAVFGAKAETKPQINQTKLSANGLPESNVRCFDRSRHCGASESNSIAGSRLASTQVQQPRVPSAVVLSPQLSRATPDGWKSQSGQSLLSDLRPPLEQTRECSMSPNIVRELVETGVFDFPELHSMQHNRSHSDAQSCPANDGAGVYLAKQTPDKVHGHGVERTWAPVDPPPLENRCSSSTVRLQQAAKNAFTSPVVVEQSYPDLGSGVSHNNSAKTWNNPQQHVMPEQGKDRNVERLAGQASRMPSGDEAPCDIYRAEVSESLDASTVPPGPGNTQHGPLGWPSKNAAYDARREAPPPEDRHSRIDNLYGCPDPHLFPSMARIAEELSREHHLGQSWDLHELDGAPLHDHILPRVSTMSPNVYATNSTSYGGLRTSEDLHGLMERMDREILGSPVTYGPCPTHDEDIAKDFSIHPKVELAQPLPNDWRTRAHNGFLIEGDYQGSQHIVPGYQQQSPNSKVEERNMRIFWRPQLL